MFWGKGAHAMVLEVRCTQGLYMHTSVVAYGFVEYASCVACIWSIRSLWRLCDMCHRRVGCLEGLVHIGSTCVYVCVSAHTCARV